MGLLSVAFLSSWSCIILHMGGYNTRSIVVLRMGGGGVCQIAGSLPVSTCAVSDVEKCVFIIFYGEPFVCTHMFVRCCGGEQNVLFSL